MSRSHSLAANRIETRHPLMRALLLQPPQPLPAAQRLIVLVPDAPAPETRLARQLFELTQPRQTPVVLLARLTDERQALRARRRLATLAALTRGAHNQVETRLVAGDWVSAVRALWEPGDLVACHAEQTLTRWGQPQPLAEALITRLRAPVYLLTGFYPDLRDNHTTHWARRLLADLGMAGILLAFLPLQLWLLHLSPAWAGKLLGALSSVLECGLLFAWDAFNSKDPSDD